MLAVAAAHTFVCVVLWLLGLTGQSHALEVYAGSVGVAFLLGNGLVELIFASRVMQSYSAGEPLHLPWRLIVAASALRIAGLALAHIGGQPLGLLISGPVQLLLLSTAGAKVLFVYRHLGLHPRLTTADYVVIGVVSAYSTMILVYVVGLWALGMKSPAPAEIAGWLLYPLLSAMLVVALLLRRAALGMGGGLISRCWSSYALAIIITTAGDMFLWLFNYGLLSYPAIMASWIVWYPAAAAYALGPVWQYEAIQYAMNRQRYPDAWSSKSSA